VLFGPDDLEAVVVALLEYHELAFDRVVVADPVDRFFSRPRAAPRGRGCAGDIARAARPYCSFTVAGPVAVADILARVGVGEYRVRAYGFDPPGLRWEVFVRLGEEA